MTQSTFCLKLSKKNSVRLSWSWSDPNFWPHNVEQTAGLPVPVYVGPVCLVVMKQGGASGVEGQVFLSVAVPSSLVGSLKQHQTWCMLKPNVQYKEINVTKFPALHQNRDRLDHIIFCRCTLEWVVQRWSIDINMARSVSYCITNHTDERFEFISSYD